MRIATWNVNSIKVRQQRLERWLRRHKPDVLCLQELKAVDEQFPSGMVEELGYEATVWGEKTYNGVAILTKKGANATEIHRGLLGPVEAEAGAIQARLVGVEVAGVRVIGVYVPNGSEVGSDKFSYKLQWLDRLAQLIAAEDKSKPLVLCGDFNCARDARDVSVAEQWESGVLCHEEVRSRLQRLEVAGLVDTFRACHPEPGHYSWWDYRGGDFQKNNGLRIDIVFASVPLARQLKGAWIDRDERKGNKPSDHVPVVADFDWL